VFYNSPPSAFPTVCTMDVTYVSLIATSHFPDLNHPTLAGSGPSTSELFSLQRELNRLLDLLLWFTFCTGYTEVNRSGTQPPHFAHPPSP